MNPLELVLAALGLIGVLWAVLLLTNDEWSRFQSFEYEEIEARRRFNNAMDRHLSGRDA